MAGVVGAALSLLLGLRQPAIGVSDGDLLGEGHVRVVVDEVIHGSGSFDDVEDDLVALVLRDAEDVAVGQFKELVDLSLGGLRGADPPGVVVGIPGILALLGDVVVDLDEHAGLRWVGGRWGPKPPVRC